MPDCEGTCGDDLPSSPDSTTTSAVLRISTDHGEDSTSVPQKPHKDPRKIARKYEFAAFL